MTLVRAKKKEKKKKHGSLTLSFRIHDGSAVVVEERIQACIEVGNE
jgi:hypothetical protein